MSADSIRMLIKGNTIDKVFFNVNCFVISQDSLLNYNQIKGRKMTTEFRDQKIDKVVVEGNGESLFFALKEHPDNDILLRDSRGANRERHVALA